MCAQLSSRSNHGACRASGAKALEPRKAKADQAVLGNNQMRSFASLDAVHDCHEFLSLEIEAATYLLDKLGIRQAAGSAEIFDDDAVDSSDPVVAPHLIPANRLRHSRR
jgi:hypothetical protein